MPGPTDDTPPDNYGRYRRGVGSKKQKEIKSLYWATAEFAATTAAPPQASPQGESKKWYKKGSNPNLTDSLKTSRKKKGRKVGKNKNKNQGYGGYSSGPNSYGGNPYDSQEKYSLIFLFWNHSSNHVVKNQGK